MYKSVATDEIWKIKINQYLIKFWHVHTIFKMDNQQGPAL